MLRELIYVSIGLVFLAYALDYVLGSADDAREPKRVNPRVPLIGHVLGLTKYGSSYFMYTSRKTEAEMYTLAAFNTKFYVCNSLRLMPLIQKASKTVSFRPFIKTAADKIAGSSSAGGELFSGALVDDYEHILRATLAPGPWLDEQSLRMGRSCAALVDTLLGGGGEEGKKIWLLGWVRHIVMQASGCGIYGQEHPFRDPVVAKAFWELHVNLPKNMAGLDFFKKYAKAREVLHTALLKYCAAPHADAGLSVFERQRVLREGGMTLEDAAKQETSVCVAIFANTAPTMFWTIWELYSRPELLEEVRQEIEANAVFRKSDMEEKKEEEKAPDDTEAETEAGFVLDVAALKTQCPLLLSVFQETQRTRHVHANIRKVLADTLLDDGRYFLRKGNYVMMPGSPIHADVRVWGQSAGAFDPYRFVPANHHAKASSPNNVTANPPPSAFLSWGAPPYLCPARQFASTEILIIMALLTMRVDLTPATRNGEWEANPALNHGELVAVCNPVEDVEMYMKAREKGLGKWALKMAGSKTRVPIASG
ncbi:cytochrome P450 [Daldinia eschscholtzii]|nr:cytochrome P450 [Daldinia eschscholtzii]